MQASKKLYILLIIFCTAIAGAVGAHAQSLKVQAPATVIQGQRFTISFRLTNATGTISQAPKLSNCTLIYGPSTSTMQSTQIYNGQVSTTTAVDYSFYYTADKAGTVTVPSISVNAEGKTLKSNSVTITVLPPDKNAHAQTHPGAPAAPQQQVVSSGKVSPEDLIVTVTLSKNHLYEQEAVVATIKVYTKHNITSFHASTLPSFEGFLSEELEVKDQVKVEHFRGSNYYTAVLKRCLLYPQKAGKLTINSGRYDVTLETYEQISNGFYITGRPVSQNITTTSNSLSVNVEALPQPQPANFSGAVGQFTASRTLDSELLRTNEAATLTYNIKGTGNIKYLKAPEIELPSSVEQYNPDTESDAHFTGSDMTGTFNIKYSFIPQQVGNFVIPASTFCYFDIAKKQYVNIDMPAINAKVVKGSEGSGATEQKDIDKTMTDIRHIKPIAPGSLVKEDMMTFGKTYYVLLYVIVLVALIASIIIYRRQLTLNADLAGRRTARANKVANKLLKEARGAMNAHKNDVFYEMTSRALWGYISDKLRIPASALTRDNITEKLTDYNANEDTINRIINILDECEMARFTPEHSDSQVSALYQSTCEVIKDVESIKSTKK